MKNHEMIAKQKLQDKIEKKKLQDEIEKKDKLRMQNKMKIEREDLLEKLKNGGMSDENTWHGV